MPSGLVAPPLTPPPPRRRRGWFVVPVVAVVAVVLFIIAGAMVVRAAVHSISHRSAAPVTGASAMHRVGQTATTSGLEVMVLSFKNPQPPTARLHAAPVGEHLVSVDVRVRNGGSDTRPFTPLFQCYLHDSQGGSYIPQIDGAHFDLKSATMQLSPGHTT